MTDHPSDTGVIEQPGDDWLMSTGEPPAPHDGTAATSPASSPRRTIVNRAGLLVAGAVAGAIVVATVQHGSSTSANGAVPQNAANGFPAAPQGGLQGGSQGGLQGGLPGGPAFGGGRAGEQHLSGTLTAVGPSSITVKTSSGTATYTVTSTSEIVRNGAPATLSQLAVGDPVFVHVYPTSSSSRLVVERVFAGDSATTGGPTGANGSTTGTHI